MSERILKALMQLFALVAKVDSVNHDGKSVVEVFLKQQLNAELVTQYLSLFEEFLEKHQKISKRTYSLWNCFYIFNSFCKFANASIHSYPQYIFYTNFSLTSCILSRYDFIRNFEI